MANKVPRYHYDLFEGPVSNSETVVLERLILNCKNELIALEQRLYNIRSNCQHEYYLVCTGVLEDTFQCKLCGGLVYR